MNKGSGKQNHKIKVMTRAEEQNKIVHRLLKEIAIDKEHYTEYEAMKSKLEYISTQIIYRIAKEDRNGKMSGESQV